MRPRICAWCTHWWVKGSADDGSEPSNSIGKCVNPYFIERVRISGMRTLEIAGVDKRDLDDIRVGVQGDFGCRFWENDAATDELREEIYGDMWEPKPPRE